MKQHKMKLNNSGMALVMVIAVIAFVSVFATIVLYIAGINFYMKTTDVKTKESFYNSEKALEEIKASFMIDASKAYENAYLEAIGFYSIKTPEDLMLYYNQCFVDEFRDIWREHTTGSRTTDPSNDQATAYLNAIVSSQYNGSISAITGGEILCNVDDRNDGTVVIKDVSFCFTDSNKYTTMITTDFVIQAPAANFDATEKVEHGVTKEPQSIKLINCVIYSDWEKK